MLLLRVQKTKYFMKLFFAPELPGVPHNILYGSYVGTWEEQHTTQLFQTFSTSAIRSLITEVVKPEEAEYILVPHNYSKIAHQEEYKKECERLSREHNVPLMVVAYGDSHTSTTFSNAIVFRSSQYQNLQKPNEIIMPAYIEDIGQSSQLRHKSEIPIVGFVGRGSATDWMRTLRDVLSLVATLPLRKYASCATSRLIQGMSVRSYAMRILENSKDIQTAFIVRKSFSGNMQSIELDPAIARTEYILNILTSDLTLSPKGDGNYSLRFYEVLSASRVPLLIDTCMTLPLEHLVDYDSFIVRVPFESIETISDRVCAWWNSLDDTAYVDMQKKARQAFEQYLRIDKFFEHAFRELSEKKRI